MAAPLAERILHSSRFNQMFILISPAKTELKQNLNPFKCQFLWFSRRKQNYHIPSTSEPRLNLKIQFYLLFFLFIYFYIYLYFYLYCVRSWDPAQVFSCHPKVLPSGYLDYLLTYLKLWSKGICSAKATKYIQIKRNSQVK